MPKSLVRVRPAGTLAWLVFSRAQPNRWFSPANIADSMHWMVLHRPVEPAALTGKLIPVPNSRINLATSCLTAVLLAQILVNHCDSKNSWNTHEQPSEDTHVQKG